MVELARFNPKPYDLPPTISAPLLFQHSIQRHTPFPTRPLPTDQNSLDVARASAGCEGDSYLHHRLTPDPFHTHTFANFLHLYYHSQDDDLAAEVAGLDIGSGERIDVSNERNLRESPQGSPTDGSFGRDHGDDQPYDGGGGGGDGRGLGGGGVGGSGEYGERGARRERRRGYSEDSDNDRGYRGRGYSDDHDEVRGGSNARVPLGGWGWELSSLL